MTPLGRIGPYLVCVLVVLVVGVALFSAYRHGQAVENASCQARWSDHQAEDARITADAQAEQRAIEAQRNNNMSKVTQDAQRTIDQLRSDAATDVSSSHRLSDELARANSRLAGSQASLNSCTAGAGEAAARYARVLADVLERADKRAGVLAAAADQSRARGLACEVAYDSLIDGAKMGHFVRQTTPFNAQ